MLDTGEDSSVYNGNKALPMNGMGVIKNKYIFSKCNTNAPE